MDDVRFDALARALTDGRSRRGALAAVVGGALGVAGLAETEAKKPCPPCKKRKQGKCKKKLPDGTACSGGTCQSGRCVATPPTGLTCSDGVKNGNESDVDCGGSCSRCGVDQVCNTRNDCETSLCSLNRCRACPPEPGFCGNDVSGVPCACKVFSRIGGGTYGGCYNTNFAHTDAASCAECPADSHCWPEDESPGVRCYRRCRQA